MDGWMGELNGGQSMFSLDDAANPRLKSMEESVKDETCRWEGRDWVGMLGCWLFVVVDDDVVVAAVQCSAIMRCGKRAAAPSLLRLPSLATTSAWW